MTGSLNVLGGNIASEYDVTSGQDVIATRDIKANNHLLSTTSITGTCTTQLTYINDIVFEGNDVAGYIQFSCTGTSIVSKDKLVTVTFNDSFGAYKPSVVLTPATLDACDFIAGTIAAGPNPVYVFQDDSSSFSIRLGNQINTTVGDFANIGFNYQIVGCPRTTNSN